MNVLEIPISDILIDSEFNCREDITNSSVFTLAADIEKNGLQQPVSVRHLTAQEKEKYEGKLYGLIMGFRRVKALSVLSRKTAPCMIKDVDLRQAKILNIGENLHRKDLSYWEEALSLKSLFDLNMSRVEIAQVTGQSEGWVQRRMLVWQMSAKAQALVKAGVLQPSHLQELYKYRDQPDFDDMLEKIQKDYQAHAKFDQEGQSTYRIKVKEIAQTSKKVSVPTKKTRTKGEILSLAQFLYDVVKLPDGPWYAITAWATGEISDQDMLAKVREFSVEIYDTDFEIPEGGVPSR